MSLKNCPDCAAPLGFNSNKCRCGWQASHVKTGPIIDCAFSPQCTTPAVLRRKMPTGWASLCYACDMRLHRERAEKWCQEMGLDTVDAKMAYCESMSVKAMPNKRQVWERVLANPTASHLAKQYANEVLRRRPRGDPGSDEDEALAA